MDRRDCVVFLIGALCGGVLLFLFRGPIPPRADIDRGDERNESAPQRLAESDPNAALDGYCPVTLVEKWRWVRGDPSRRVEHDGQVFLFSGQQEQELFQGDPERYSPAFSGNDVVLAQDESRTVSGKPEHGVKYEERIYLFAGEDSLQRFAQDPKRYLDNSSPENREFTAGNAAANDSPQR